MTLTKADLIRRLNKSEMLNKVEAAKAIDLLLEIIKRKLESGESVTVSGFGKFSVVDKKARRGRNPRTGEDLILEARRVVRFKPSGVLRRKMNQN